jgi:hypothetical protein
MKKLLIATLIAFASPAGARPLTASDLLMECLAAKGFCHGLLLGMVHTSNQLCVPKNVGSEQMRLALLGYLASKRISRTNYSPTGLDLAFEARSKTPGPARRSVSSKRRRRRFKSGKSSKHSRLIRSPAQAKRT